MKRGLAYGATLAAAFGAGLAVPEPETSRDWVSGYVISVYDGDTCTASVDLGFGIVIVEDFRLLGVDTPELKGETKAAAERSRDWVAAQVAGKRVRIREHGKEKFGRFLAEIEVNGKDLSQEIIRKGLGVAYWGGTKE